MKKYGKYTKIVNYFIEKIENQELKYNEPIMPESEICKMFDVSHMTYNKSMNELVNHGYLKRIKSKGTFVDDNYKRKSLKRKFSTTSMTKMIEEAGYKPSSSLYHYSIIKGSDNQEVSKILEIAPNEYMHYFIRLRYGDDNLICISTSYVSQKVLPTIDINALENSFNDYVDKMGIKRSYGYRAYNAAMPNEWQAKIIKDSNTPLLVQTIMWNADGCPFEYTKHYFVGDRIFLSEDSTKEKDENTIVL